MKKPSVVKMNTSTAKSLMSELINDIADKMQLPSIPIKSDFGGEDYGENKLVLQHKDEHVSYKQETSGSAWGEHENITFSYSGEKGNISIQCEFGEDAEGCKASEIKGFPIKNLRED